MNTATTNTAGQTRKMRAVSIPDGDDINKFNPAPQETAEIEKAKPTLSEILQAARIYAHDDYPVPPRALSIIHELDAVPFGTLGNFSLFTGKAKSKKTFLMCMVLAACITSGTMQGTIKCELPGNKRRIIWIDTEQSKYHVWRRLQTIAALSGINETSNIEAYSFREFPPDQRRDLIEHLLIEDNKALNIGLIVIDGIRDLIHDINDPKEATTIATKLMQWTTIAGCHIITVLHQNKNDTNARGHVGAELLNKAESCISVTVAKDDKNVSMVEAESSRDKDFPPFAFRINETGLPEIIADYANNGSDGKKKAFNPYYIQPERHKEVLTIIFGRQKSYNRPDFIAALISGWGAFDQAIGNSKANTLVQYYRERGWIENQANEGKPAQWVYNGVTSVNDDPLIPPDN